MQNSTPADTSKKQLFTQIGRIVFVAIVMVIGVTQLLNTIPQSSNGSTSSSLPSAGASQAAEALKQLAIKGRAPKTGYARELFSSGWGTIDSCDVRNYILTRDMAAVTYVDKTCKVNSGTLDDPYTGKTIQFTRGAESSSDVQIDHVVALGDAWQKGAQGLSAAERYSLANDPLELLAVDGKTNQAKGDSDASTWLPPNKAFRCSYVARQIAVKIKYKLWVTQSEYQTMASILSSCPTQQIPTTTLPQNPAN